jgi:hypothetical protein
MTNSQRQRGKSRSDADMSFNMTINNSTIPMRSLYNLPLKSPKAIHLQITLILSEVYPDMQNQETHGKFIFREPKRSRVTSPLPNEPLDRNEIIDAVPDQHVSCGFRYLSVDFD